MREFSTTGPPRMLTLRARIIKRNKEIEEEIAFNAKKTFHVAREEIRRFCSSPIIRFLNKRVTAPIRDADSLILRLSPRPHN